MNPDTLKLILEKHLLWRKGLPGEERANLARANLAGAYLAGAYLADADLADADLARADLAGADLAGAYLADANLAGADLARADLADAYLARANLARANLARANLAGANLAGAYLAGADLARANLARANLAGADLAQSRGLPYAQVAFSGHGECGRLLSAVKLDGEWKLFCGCFKGTFDDLDAYIRDGKAEHRESRTLARKVLHMLCDHEDQKGNNP